LICRLATPAAKPSSFPAQDVSGENAFNVLAQIAAVATPKRTPSCLGHELARHPTRFPALVHSSEVN
jgi:hypothetical protein